MKQCVYVLRGVAIFCALMCIMACSHGDDEDDTWVAALILAENAAESENAATAQRTATLVKTVTFEEEEGFVANTHYKNVLPLENNIGMDWKVCGNISTTGAIYQKQSLLMRLYEYTNVAATVIPNIQDLMQIEFYAKRYFSKNQAVKTFKESVNIVLTVSCLVNGEEVCSEEFTLCDDAKQYSVSFPAAKDVTITFTVSIPEINTEEEFKVSDAIIDNISFYALR